MPAVVRVENTKCRRSARRVSERKAAGRAGKQTSRTAESRGADREDTWLPAFAYLNSDPSPAIEILVGGLTQLPEAKLEFSFFWLDFLYCVSETIQPAAKRRDLTAPCVSAGTETHPRA